MRKLVRSLRPFQDYTETFTFGRPPGQSCLQPKWRSKAERGNKTATGTADLSVAATAPVMVRVQWVAWQTHEKLYIRLTGSITALLFSSLTIHSVPAAQLSISVDEAGEQKGTKGSEGDGSAVNGLGGSCSLNSWTRCNGHIINIYTRVARVKPPVWSK